MSDFSILIAGKAGFGIDKAGSVIGRILNGLGYRIYIYRDYPSIIRGGHTFSIIRISPQRIAAHLSKVDLILALNQDAVSFHKNRLKENSIVIYDSDTVNPQGLDGRIKQIGIRISEIVKTENAAEIMRNTCIIGAFCKCVGIKWDILDSAFKKEIKRELDLNLKVAARGYEAAGELTKIETLTQNSLPLITGNQAIGLGLIKAGLGAYIAYPMTPSSPLLHFLAEKAQDFNLKVIHPESEIGVILMALGFSYMGEKVAVGTSGGGFCLMTEGLSLAGMSELPIVIVLGQRPGPSTGLPTYSSQTELHFALNAGQGEFPRFIVAPGDAEEAYYWSAIAANMAWKCQIPAIILYDKNLGEGTYNFDRDAVGEIKEEGPVLWDRKSAYRKYLDAPSGVSPLAFVPDKDAVIKVNSYEHDESGITTEDPGLTKFMQDKRLRKVGTLTKELEAYKTVEIYGDKNSQTAILCWGSNKGVCVEAAQNLGLKVIQPIVLWPFPEEALKMAVQGIKKLICVESNATAQLLRLMRGYGLDAQEKILKYDGRPFALDELEEALKKYAR